MKTFVLGSLAVVLAGSVGAQQLQPMQVSQPLAPQACISQYTPVPGRSAAALITAGYDIKAAVPGGMWMQKNAEVFYCNTGRPVENEALCWQLREPGPGGPC